MIIIINIILMANIFQPMLTQTDSFSAILQRNRNIFPNFGLIRTLLDINEANKGRLQVTNLDRLRGLMVVARHLSLWQVNENIDELYRVNREKGKLQPVISEAIEFPCNLTNARSKTSPTSVHRLRPGDIDVIAAIGDSLTAGNAILSTSLVHTLNEFRGVVFSAGGYSTWRHILTLPNILKVFNPNLYGYSTRDGLVVDSVSRLNVAEPMIMSRDLPYQTSVLVKRMRLDPNVDMKRHWKLLTIFNGCNDLCSDMCHHETIDKFLERHERDLRRIFTMLRDQVPRLLINFVPAPNIVTTLYAMKNKSPTCEAIHAAGCSCVFSRRFNATDMQRIFMDINRWQKLEERLTLLPEFQTEEFAIVYQPFLESPSLRSLPNGDTDFRYFANDCFHFSQLGQACLANSLWNNMLQPIGHKQLHLSEAFQEFFCPTEERPYIATIGNSESVTFQGK